MESVTYFHKGASIYGHNVNKKSFSINKTQYYNDIQHRNNSFTLNKYKLLPNNKFQISCSSQEVIPQKLITKTDLPEFLPRDDFLFQMYRWAQISAGSMGLQNYGMMMDVQPIYKDDNNENELWGFYILLKRDDVEVGRLSIELDREKVEKYQFIGIGEDGFPKKEGKMEIIEGKSLGIWKVGDFEVDDEMRQAVKDLCKGFSAAVTAYYAFGSCFSEDAT